MELTTVWIILIAVLWTGYFILEGFDFGVGMLALLFAVFALWAIRKDRRPTAKWFALAALAVPFMPLLGNSFGWIFTEMGRQPWIVFGLMQTEAGVSQAASTTEVWITLIGFTLLYGVLAVIEFGLLSRTIKQGPPAEVSDPFADSDSPDRQLTISY